jgi:hypothetical protein
LVAFSKLAPEGKLIPRDSSSPLVSLTGLDGRDNRMC